MYVKEKKKNHFLYLLENNEFSSAYFFCKDFNEFDEKKLRELQNNVENARVKYKNATLLFSVVKFLNNTGLIHGITLKIAQARQNFLSNVGELNIFESNIAFLIISNIISTQAAEKLGFSNEYVKSLLEKYKKEADNPYVEYYYDENTGRTSKLMASGTMLILPYTPHAVKRNLEK